MHNERGINTHTLGVHSYSFISEAQPMDRYKFNIQKFQSYLLSKSKGRVNKKMIHVMFYHGVENVPMFQEQMDLVKTKGANEPIKMKFLANTPLAQKRGINMLMPVSKDVRLTDASNIPDPPGSPIIEDEEGDESEEEEDTKWSKLEGDRVVEGIEGDDSAEYVTSGPTHESRSTPVICKPARPDPPKMLKAKTKVHSKPAVKEDVRDYPTAPSESSGSSIRPKARPKPTTTDSASSHQPEATSASATSSGSRPTASSDTPEDTSASTSNIDRTVIGLTGQTSTRDDSLWTGYTGSLSDVRDTNVEHTVRPINPPPPPRRESDRHNQSEWRPRMTPSEHEVQSRPWRQQRRALPLRFRYRPTGAHYFTDKAWEELGRLYPNALDDDDFYFEEETREWFIKEYF